MKVLVGAFNQEKALVGGLPGYYTNSIFAKVCFKLYQQVHRSQDSLDSHLTSHHLLRHDMLTDAMLGHVPSNPHLDRDQVHSGSSSEL